MLNEQAKGVYVIAVTPFTETGEIDEPSVDRVVDFYLENGVHGLTILGMMGEAPKLTFEESLALARRVLARVAGRVPVVVGVSHPGLANLVRLARSSVDAGAAGVLVAPQAGLRVDDQVFGYYASVCEVLGEAVPVVVQDYPQSTGVYLSVPTFNRLVRDFPQIVMLKHEDCPGLGKLTAVRDTAAREGLRRVSILVGNGGLYFPQELQRGVDGAMTGFAYPEMLVGVFERFAVGDREGAEDLFDTYLPLVRHEQQPGFGLAVRKEILRRRGAIACAALRSPGPRLMPADHQELDGLIGRLQRRLQQGH